MAWRWRVRDALDDDYTGSQPPYDADSPDCPKCKNNGVILNTHGGGWIPCPVCNVPDWDITAPNLCPVCYGVPERYWHQVDAAPTGKFWSWCTEYAGQGGLWRCPVCDGEGTLAGAVAQRMGVQGG